MYLWLGPGRDIERDLWREDTCRRIEGRVKRGIGGTGSWGCRGGWTAVIERVEAGGRMVLVGVERVYRSKVVMGVAVVGRIYDDRSLGQGCVRGGWAQHCKSRAETNGQR